jgi:DNA polymerase (family 10)
LTNLEIADALDRLADLLQVERENPFKVRAFRRAARTVEGYPQPMARLLAAGGDPTLLPGVGKEIAACIRELVTTGQLARLQVLERNAPPSLLELQRLPGLGPKRARLVWDKLGVATLEELEAASRDGRLATLPGFGEKTATRLLAALAEKRTTGRRLLLPTAALILDELLPHLRAVPGVMRAEAAGSFRRRLETVGDLDVVVASTDAPRALSAFTGWHRTARVEGAGDTRATIVLRRGAQVDLRVVPPESFGAAWIYLTGSKAHNVALRALAVRRGWKLSEWALFDQRHQKGGRDDSGARLAGASEEEVYAALGLAWVPPELREDVGELEAAAAGTLPDLVRLEQLRGDLQMHTTWSDGRASVGTMVAACADRGYAYCAITDHGPGLPVVQGLDAVALRAQHAEIAEAQARHPEIRVLRALELDLLGDGALALADEALGRLDVVLAAVHTRLKLPRDEQTRRYLRALDHPRVAILAHPTARRLGMRGPVDADWPAILQRAAARGVAIEANASPERLDANGDLLRQAKAAGCRVVISTDAHRVRELDNLRWGVDQARRAGLEAGDVLNTLPLQELLAALRVPPRP